MGKEDYNKEVLNEGGFIVELSNQGGLKKPNPNFYNPERKKLKCVAAQEKALKEWEPISCDKMTATAYRVCSKHNKLKCYPHHTKDWLGRTIPPEKTREEFLTFALPHLEISKALINWIGKDEKKGKQVDLFVDEILEKIHGKIPDATTLQKINIGEVKEKDAISPNSLVSITKKLVDKHFPKKEFNSIRLAMQFRGNYNIPVRIVLTNLVLAFACEEANRGDSFGTKKAGLRPRYANMFMPLALYLLLRKGATETEAKISVRG